MSCVICHEETEHKVKLEPKNANHRPPFIVEMCKDCMNGIQAKQLFQEKEIKKEESLNPYNKSDRERMSLWNI